MAARAATIDGPDGVSNSKEKYIPETTAIIPIRHANIAIASGDRDNWRAAAGAIISMDAIRSMPTIFMETATTIVIKSIKSISKRETRTLSAIAKSSWIVIKISEDQFKESAVSTKPPPMNNHQSCSSPTVKISPNR